MPAVGDTAPGLVLPVDCTLGETCYIQQYVDRDPTAGVEDFACGKLANDGHKGTDFAVPSEAAMATGVAVRAAAGGIVRGMRDGMPDLRRGTDSAAEVAGAECGNGVLIDHGDGWETQYCHLRQGSVTVATGDMVAAGQTLGLIGMSGLASFPHVHVELRHDGMVIDPFHPDMAQTCGASRSPLWHPPLPYMPGGPISAGLADAPPSLEAAEKGLQEDRLFGVAGIVVLWVMLANAEEGDLVTFEIDGPEDQYAKGEQLIPATQPFRLTGMGLRAPRMGFPDGHWTGTVIHSRDGEELGRRVVQADMP